MGHTDVVPANPAGWRRDPFGGDLVDDIVWGRGATDMLNLTATMAVATRRLAVAGFRPRGTLIYLAVADEEAGGDYGAQYLTAHALDAVRADYVITESGGVPVPTPGGPGLPLTVGEKGVNWRRIAVHGTPGHGSQAVPLRQRARDGGRGRAADRRLPTEGAHPRRLAPLRGGRAAGSATWRRR